MSFQPEERYWTDYLRIALPVVGLLLLIGLLWYWASALIGDGGGEPPATQAAIAEITPINAATPVPTETPTAVALTATPGPPPAPTATAVVNVTEPPAPTPAPTTPPAAAEADAGNPCAGLPTYQVGTIVVTTEDVNLRDGPSTNNNPITTLPTGTRLQITGEFSEAGQCDWWPVTVVDTGQTGFVIEQYLQMGAQ